MINIKITDEEYKQISYALHFTSNSEAKPVRYNKYKWDFAGLRHKKFNDLDFNE